MIVYVETHLNLKNSVIGDVALVNGVNPATVKVNEWFNKYSAFVYDKTSGDLVFYKSRYAGYWENDSNLEKYKM